MALFFDRLWFDQKLATWGLSRGDMAASAHLSQEDMKLIFKDQMEVAAFHVSAWATLLNEPEVEIARRCGVSTPLIAPPAGDQRMVNLEARVAHLEAQIDRLLKQQDANS